MRFLPLVLLVSACALTPPAGDVDPTQSGTIAASRLGRVAYVVLTDHGQVARVDVAGAHSVVDVGLEPTRIAVTGDRAYVTLRGERSVVELRESGRGLTVGRKVEVGAEPYGIVASRDGERIFVAASQSGEIVELNADLEVVNRIAVAGEPRWLALHEPSNTLFVAGAMARDLASIDLDTGAVQFTAMPEVRREKVTGDVVVTVPRFTGDIGVRDDDGEIGIPVLYADNVTPVGDGGDEGEDTDGDGIPDDGGYGGVGMDPGGVGRMTATVVRMGVDADGSLFNARPQRSLAFVEAPDSDFGFGTTGSYVAQARYAPNGEGLVTVVEGAGRVVFTPEEFVFQGMGGLFGANGNAVYTGAGTRGVAWIDGKLVADAAFDRAMAVVAQVPDGSNGDLMRDMPMGSDARPDEVFSLAQEILPADVVAGRKLFYDAMSPSMTGGSGGVSCATCHTDGRNDGLTWPLVNGPRQTPSLAGKVSETAPVTWTEGVASVGDEAKLTSEIRMGGHGLDQSAADAIQAFVDFTREVDNPARFVESDAVARGADAFLKAGCAACHTGPRHTDNLGHDLYGVRGVNTPSLTGIVATAPYLHDGSAPTLRDVLLRSRDGSMGDTSVLSDDELADLEAYLKSL